MRLVREETRITTYQSVIVMRQSISCMVCTGYGPGNIVDGNRNPGLKCTDVSCCLVSCSILFCVSLLPRLKKHTRLFIMDVVCGGRGSRNSSAAEVPGLLTWKCEWVLNVICDREKPASPDVFHGEWAQVRTVHGHADVMQYCMPEKWLSFGGYGKTQRCSVINERASFLKRTIVDKAPHAVVVLRTCEKVVMSMVDAVNPINPTLNNFGSTPTPPKKVDNQNWIGIRHLSP